MKPSFNTGISRQFFKQTLCLIITWLSLAVCTTALADFKETPQGKLTAAQAYADKFLKEDAKPGQQFFTRTPKFPTWKDQPIIDCPIYGIARAIETREPYFENKKNTVVIVPVWVELLALSVPGHAGYPFGTDEEGTVQCRFEYEQYSFAEKRFVREPDLLKKRYIETFQNWGEFAPGTEKSRGGGLSVDINKRYVRFKFRVSVAREAPYQLYPQFPRHHLAKEALVRLDWVIDNVSQSLNRGVSTREPSLTGSELQKDLLRMRRQTDENQWITRRIRNGLADIESIPSFSEIQPLTPRR